MYAIRENGITDVRLWTLFFEAFYRRLGCQCEHLIVAIGFDSELPVNKVDEAVKELQEMYLQGITFVRTTPL